MNKIAFLALIATLCFFSCSDSPNELSSGRIEDLVEDELEDRLQEQYYATFSTGYYELNSLSDRQILMKLKAAGIITYQVERYAWYNKETSTNRVLDHYNRYYNIWYGVQSEPVYVTKKTTEYELEQHYIVKVELTEKGKDICVDSIPTAKPKEDKEMKGPDIVLKEFPENNIDLKEKWPELKKPGEKRKNTVSKQPEKQESYSDNTIKDDYDTYDEKNAGGDGPVDMNTYKAYKNALKNVHKAEAILKSFKIKVSHARNIQIFTGEHGVYATCEVIFKIKDVTPAGRIFHGVYNDSPMKCPVALRYYYDKGWKLENGIDLNELSRPEVNFVNENDTIICVVDTAAVDY